MSRAGGLTGRRLTHGADEANLTPWLSVVELQKRHRCKRKLGSRRIAVPVTTTLDLALQLAERPYQAVRKIRCDCEASTSQAYRHLTPLGRHAV